MGRISTLGLGALVALMVPVAAEAAEMRLKAPVMMPAPPPPFSWTGFYIGGTVGGALSRTNISDDRFGFSVTPERSGFIGGGEVGVNYQFTNVVIGFEGTFDGTSLNTTGNGVFIPGVGTLQGSINTDWIATAAGRLGLAYDRVLWYAKGGGAWVQNSASITNLTTGASISASNTNSGFVAGGGIEWAFVTNWTVKAEYDFIGLQHVNFSGLAFPTDIFTVRRDIQTFKVGLNYKFDFGAPPASSPVVTKY